MKKKKEILKSGWCPLFGQLPFSPYPPSKPSSRCIQLIQDSRKLWDVPFLNGIRDNTVSDYPSIDEISNWLSDFGVNPIG